MQQLKIFTLLTTLCESADETFTCQVGRARGKLIQSLYNTLKNFENLTTVCGKQARITFVVQECFHTICGVLKDVKKSELKTGPYSNASNGHDGKQSRSNDQETREKSPNSWKPDL